MSCVGGPLWRLGEKKIKVDVQRKRLAGSKSTETHLNVIEIVLCGWFVGRQRLGRYRHMQRGRVVTIGLLHLNAVLIGDDASSESRLYELVCVQIKNNNYIISNYLSIKDGVMGPQRM